MSSAAEIPLPATSPMASATCESRAHLVIVIIAGYDPRRAANRGETQRFGLRRHSRVQLVLHLARDFDLRLQAFLFLGHRQQVRQVLGHAVEGNAQFGELIFPAHFDAMREIALHDALGSFIEVMHGAGDVAGHGDPDHPANDFDQDEHNHSGDQDQLQEFLREIGLAIEHRGQDRRHASQHRQFQIRGSAGGIPIERRHGGEPDDFRIEPVGCRRQCGRGAGSLRRCLRRLIDSHQTETGHQPGEVFASQRNSDDHVALRRLHGRKEIEIAFTLEHASRRESPGGHRKRGA